MYLIATDDRVLYKSKPGPFGFHPQDLAAALQKAVGTPNQSRALAASSK
jgi:hypothetical protein